MGRFRFRAPEKNCGNSYFSDRLLVVGTLNQQYGFTYYDNQLREFQYPAATYTTFNGVNNKGVVVGTYYIRKTGAFGIFTYDTGTGIWTDLPFGEYASAIPVGITDSGVIAAKIGVDSGLVIATPNN